MSIASSALLYVLWVGIHILLLHNLLKTFTTIKSLDVIFNKFESSEIQHKIMWFSDKTIELGYNRFEF